LKIQKNIIRKDSIDLQLVEVDLQLQKLPDLHEKIKFEVLHYDLKLSPLKPSTAKPIKSCLPEN